MATRLVIPSEDVEDGVFTFHSLGERITANIDLMKNKKAILERLATVIIHPGRDKVKTFREPKKTLVDMISPYLVIRKKEDLDDWVKVEWKLEKFTIPPDEYYVGDLFGVMTDEIRVGVWGKKFKYEAGIYRRKSDGAYFAVQHTDHVGCQYIDVHSASGRKLYELDGHIGIASAVLCDKSVCPDEFHLAKRFVDCEFKKGKDEEYTLYSLGSINMCIWKKSGGYDEYD